MGDPNLGQTVASSWDAIVKANPEDNIFEDYWLLDQFKVGNGFKYFDGGRLIEAPLEYATNTTVSSFSDLDTVSTTRVDIVDVAQYSWKEYGGVVVHSELEACINQGSGGKFDLLAAKLNNLKKSTYKRINEDLYGAGTGNGGKDLGGLALLVPSTTTSGTVGGINRATFPWFRNISVSGAGSSFSILRASMTSCYNQCSNGVYGDHPTVGVTDRTSFQGYEGLLTANERFIDKTKGEGAFKNEALLFKGMKLAYDNDCTSGSMFFLNPKYLKLAVCKGAWQKMYDAVEPANQYAKVFKTRTQCNLITTNPRMLGVVYSIA